mgnify:CR=1 FL=1
MLKKHILTYSYFLGAFFFIIMSFLQPSDEAIDITAGDTYFVILKAHFLLVLASIFLFFGGISLLFRKIRMPLLNSLSIAHILLTIISLICLYYLSIQMQPVREFHDYSVTDDFNKHSDSHLWSVLISFVCACFVIAQLVFLANIFIAIFRKSK